MGIGWKLYRARLRTESDPRKFTKIGHGKCPTKFNKKAPEKILEKIHRESALRKFVGKVQYGGHFDRANCAVSTKCSGLQELAPGLQTTLRKFVGKVQYDGHFDRDAFAVCIKCSGLQELAPGLQTILRKFVGKIQYDGHFDRADFAVCTECSGLQELAPGLQTVYDSGTLDFTVFRLLSICPSPWLLDLIGFGLGGFEPDLVSTLYSAVLWCAPVGLVVSRSTFWTCGLSANVLGLVQVFGL